MTEPNSNAASGSMRGPGEDATWRHELRAAIRSARQLCNLLGLTDKEISRTADDSTEFPVLVPRSFAARIRYGDPHDPLLLQVIAQRAEQIAVPGFGTDPLLESQVAGAGILRKYRGRALLVTTAACPVHCRYCFRRHFPYADQLAARDRWAHALDSLRESTDVEEVILSGGDPLSLSTRRLAELIEGLETIDSVKTLRVHTRFPIVLPSRVTRSLLGLLHRTRMQTVFVLHCNHANELDSSDVADALQNLSECTDLLLNQSVLLRGVNDTPQALRDLSIALFRANVMPYYLHLLDRVSGSAHFDVPEAEASELMIQLRSELPGYLVPKLVRENPGALSKTPIL
jgi:EF-P beta-lysylation protein EpmB